MSITFSSKIHESSSKCLALLREHEISLALAESCTGGLISKSITDHSGASDVFECGVVSYSGKIKHKLLNIKKETLHSYGEVSAQTADEMAKGVAHLADASIGVGVTGIAGPTGATVDKRVGLIYVGIYFQGTVYSYKLELYDDLSREQRRESTALFVFNKIIELIA